MKKLILSLSIISMILLFSSCSFSNIDKMSPEDPTPTIQVAPTATQPPTPTNILTIPTVVPSPTPVAIATDIPSTSIPTPGESSSDNRNIAEELLKNMTLEEKVGQLFFVRCRQEFAEADIKTYHLGGYILFMEDFKDKSKETVTDAIKNYQKLSKIPMLIGVDEEGGVVNRISRFTEFRSASFLSPQDLYLKGGFELITTDTIEKAVLLKSLGININLAPVCDVSTNPDDFIYQRSFGQDAKATSSYVQKIVAIMNSEGIGCTLKHFPGYGNNVDTHTGIAIDNRSYDSFLKSDFLPFEAGIEAGAGSILISHNIVTSMDDEYPASLSKEIHRILREDLGFEGVIMTDDLSMDAITEYTGNQEAAVMAINAGNDLLIASDFDVQIPAVIAAVKDHTISEAQINEAVLRVLLWKFALNKMN